MARTDRPPTPEAVKQQLRSEAGFGCCKCGAPIIEYHHIVPWELEEHFRVEDMMLLCPNHHAEATAGAMLQAEQRKLKTNPRNKRKGYVDGTLKINTEAPIVRLGGTTIINDGPVLVLNGRSAVALNLGDHGRVELSLELHSRTGDLLLLVDRNEWIVGEPSVWDAEIKFQRIRIRNGKAKVAIDVDCRREPILIKGQFWVGGSKVTASPDRLAFALVDKPGEISFSNLLLPGCCFYYDVKNGHFDTLRVDPDPRFGKMPPFFVPPEGLEAAWRWYRQAKIEAVSPGDNAAAAKEI